MVGAHSLLPSFKECLGNSALCKLAKSDWLPSVFRVFNVMVLWCFVASLKCDASETWIAPSPQIFMNIDEFSPEPPLLQAQQTQLSQPLLTREVLQSLQHLDVPLLDCLQCVILLLNWGAKNWTQCSTCSFTSLEYRGRITSLDLLAMPCLTQPSQQQGHAAGSCLPQCLSEHCSPFLQGYLTAGLSPVCRGAWGYLSPCGRLVLSVCWTAWSSWEDNAKITQDSPQNYMHEFVRENVVHWFQYGIFLTLNTRFSFYLSHLKVFCLFFAQCRLLLQSGKDNLDTATSPCSFELNSITHVCVSIAIILLCYFKCY